MKKLSSEEFIQKLEEKNKFYKNGFFQLIGEFVNCRTKIEVLTPYGICDSNPYALLAGNVPTIQTAVNKTDYFINRAIEIHGDKYNYEKVVYKFNNRNVEIICEDHGIFIQKPNYHLLGQGCPKCNKGGWENKLSNWLKLKSNTARFYILRCFSNEEIFIKIGITSTTIKERYSGKDAIYYDYEVIHETISTDKGMIWDLEAKILKELQKYRYTPNKKFGGYTECFSIEALSLISKLIIIN